MSATTLQEPDCAKQGPTSDKPAAANNTRVAARTQAAMKDRKTDEAIEDRVDGRVMADEDGEFIT